MKSQKYEMQNDETKKSIYLNFETGKKTLVKSVSSSFSKSTRRPMDHGHFIRAKEMNSLTRDSMTVVNRRLAEILGNRLMK